jgi:hypothetical protein
LSKRKIATDYPTAVKFLKANNFDLADFSDFLKPLRKRSPFLRRYRLPREKQVTQTMIRDFITTAREIRVSRDKNHHVRNITKDCAYQCAYHDLCRGELNGLDMSHLRKSRFTYREIVEHGETYDEELEEAELED